jgi:hypothetical protein
MTAKATVTPMSQAPSVRTNHVWLVKPRADDPNRHIRTCRRDACGLMKRSEQVDGAWAWLWRWPDLKEGQGRSVPPCRGGEVLSQPAPEVVAAPALTVVSPPRQPGRPGVCSRCAPPCGRPARLFTGGWMCDFQAGLIRAARQNASGGDVA